ncbi:hypothetical protein Bca4012_034187 [Brassica carinata]
MQLLWDGSAKGVVVEAGDKPAIYSLYLLFCRFTERFVDNFLGSRALMNANLHVAADIANFSYVQYLNSCCPQLFMSEEKLLKAKEELLMAEEARLEAEENAKKDKERKKAEKLARKERRIDTEISISPTQPETLAMFHLTEEDSI